jgi:hypothetical protein
VNNSKSRIFSRNLTALLSGALLLGSIPAAGQPAATSPVAVATRVCTGCHGLQVVMDTPKDYDAWHGTVQKMIDHGAQGTPEDFEAVMDFLFQNMTTVDVNHGDEEELMVVLHAPKTAVDAIMARREKKPFQNLADLEQSVPGLDKTVLDAKKRMLFFQ